jgi:tetratricopeptide (TPR) repeat protein
MSRRLAIACALACSFGAPAYGDDFEAARRAFALGIAHFDAGRFEEAAGQFRRSLAIRDTAPVYLNLGLALRGMNDHVAAIEALAEFIERSSDGDAAFLAHARSMLADSESKVVRLVLIAEGGADEVLVDGALALEGDGARKLVLVPGEHRFVARRAGHDVVIETRILDAGSITEVRLDASRNSLLVRASDPPPPLELDPPRPPPAPITSQWWFWTSIAAACAAIGGAAALAMAIDRPPSGGNLGVVLETGELR